MSLFDPCSHCSDNTCTVLITAPSCWWCSWGLLTVVIWATVGVFAPQLLTNLSLVVQVKLGVFICRANKKEVVSQSRNSLSAHSHTHTHTLVKPQLAFYMSIVHVNTGPVISLSFMLTTADLAKGKRHQQLIMTGVFSNCVCVCCGSLLRADWSWQVKGITKWEVRKGKDEVKVHL